MKTNFVIYLLVSASLLACGGNGEGKGENESSDSTMVEGQSADIDLSSMQELDLREFGLGANIYLPKDQGKLIVEESAYGTIVVELGERFAMEVVPFAENIVDKRNELEQGSVFQIEVLEERKDYMFYKKYIPGSEVLEEYHFYLTKEIDGEIVAVKTLDDMELKEGAARKILESAKTLSSLPFS